MLLFDLPTDISITVLTDWVVNFKALSALDVAVGHAHRREWFALIGNPVFIMPRPPPRPISEEIANVLIQWVNTRLLKSVALVVTPALIGTFTKMSSMALRSVTSLQLNDTPCKPKQFTNANSDYIKSLLLLLPSLTAVDLIHSSEQIKSLVLTHLNSMPDMPLKNLHADTNEAMCAVLATTVGMFCQSLLILELGTITAALLNLISKKCANLQSLYIHCAVDIFADIITESLASDRLPLLTTLFIRDSWEVMTDEVAMAIFAKHPILTNFCSDEGATMLILACAFALKCCPNLTSYRTGGLTFSKAVSSNTTIWAQRSKKQASYSLSLNCR